MGRAAVICISVLVLTALSAQQNRVRGQIKNRNGAPEPQCQIDFYPGQEQQLLYRAYSDKNGFFYLDNPRQGKYDVVVSQSSRSNRFPDVSIVNDGSKVVLSPDVLIVPW